MNEYPKMLYRGEQYTDWQQFTNDLSMKKIETCSVNSIESEAEKRAEGFTDAATLMAPQQTDGARETLTLPRRGRPPKVQSVNSQ